MLSPSVFVFLIVVIYSYFQVLVYVFCKIVMYRCPGLFSSYNSNIFQLKEYKIDVFSVHNS